jgi:ankyrin repeat protein
MEINTKWISHKHLLHLGLVATLVTSLALVGCASKDEKARESLSKLSLPYTSDSFVNVAGNNDLKALQLYIDAGIDPNVKNNNNETALMVASRKGNLETVQALLQAQANVNSSDSQGNTALSYAIETSQLQVVQILLEHNADANRVIENKTPVALAINSGNADVLKLLLSKGADPNKQQDGTTALAMAVEKQMLDVVSVLLEHKANPNVKTIDGDSLIIYTIKNKDSQIAKKLIDYGADITEKDARGVGLLTLSQVLGLSDIYETLISKGIRDISLLTFPINAKTNGIRLPNVQESNNLTIGAHQNYPHPQVTFNLEGKAKSFSGTFSSGRKNFESEYIVKLIIEGDGKKLFESDYLSMGSAPQSIDLDVSGVQKLTFQIQTDQLFSVVESKGIINNPNISLP